MKCLRITIITYFKSYQKITISYNSLSVHFDYRKKRLQKKNEKLTLFKLRLQAPLSDVPFFRCSIKCIFIDGRHSPMPENSFLHSRDAHLIISKRNLHKHIFTKNKSLVRRFLVEYNKIYATPGTGTSIWHTEQIYHSSRKYQDHNLSQTIESVVKQLQNQITKSNNKIRS